MHDRRVKRTLYAENGVKEYWIVDPDEQSVEVLSLANGCWQPAGFFTSDAKMRSVLLPKFALSLPKLFGG